MKLRDATKNDILLLVKLIKGDKAIEDYPNQYSPAVLTEMLNWAHILIAEESKEFAGCAIYFGGGKRKRAYLDAIAVAKKYRGKGIGSALVLEIEKRAKREGSNRIGFLVRTWNKPMQKLARKMNFRAPEKLLFYQKKI